jgi:hypothetical protein
LTLEFGTSTYERQSEVDEVAGILVENDVLKTLRGAYHLITDVYHAEY